MATCRKKLPEPNELDTLDGTISRLEAIINKKKLYFYMYIFFFKVFFCFVFFVFFWYFFKVLVLVWFGLVWFDLSRAPTSCRAFVCRFCVLF